jgi:hypothetical protein
VHLPVVGCQIIAAGFDKKQLGIEFSVQNLQSVQVRRNILTVHINIDINISITPYKR